MSFKELFGLCAGMDDTGMHLLNSNRSARRRSAQKSTDVTQDMYTQTEESSSLQSPTSPHSSTSPPLSSLPSTRTSFSFQENETESELSSVPSDLSDYDAEPLPKRRKTEHGTASRRQSQTASRASTGSLKKQRKNQRNTSLIVVLKVTSDRLREVSHNLEHASQQAFSLSAATLQSTTQPQDSVQDGDLALLTPPATVKRKRAGRPKKLTTPSSPQAFTPDPPAVPHVADPIPDDVQPLVEVSKQLMALSSCPIDTKPAPIGSPEVWAEGRQALCESLPYYRSYQSAGYCTNGFAISFMFDQEGSPRDYMDSEVVIARSGGGLSRDKTTGKMARQADQTEGSQVKSVRNSVDQFNPVAILCGNRNLQCPSKMPHVYNVLDWFKPTHIWFEKVNGMANIRYRFEKLRKDTQSWWASSQGPEPTRIGDQEPPHVRCCSQCQQLSQQVYLQGWMCLQPDCPQFWKTNSGNEPQEAGLLYDPRFLKQHTPWPHASAPQPLRPDHLSLGPNPILGDDVSWAAAKGLVCPQCGRCNSREAWEGWECGNPTCAFTHRLPHADIPASALHDPYNPRSAGYAPSRDWFAPALPLRVAFAHNYRINRVALPGTDGGFVAHLVANAAVNSEPAGPDAMWLDLQTAPDLGLRRRPLACSTLQGPLLTQHFAVNYGMPYKFVAATSSRPFAGAAAAVVAARSRLDWAARLVGGSQDAFNELLALGYFERQKIDYHDDGERGLGPTIATLSLGAPATMKVRLKAKHCHGVSKAGAYVNVPPVAGADRYEERVAAHEELERLRREGDEGAYKARLKALPEELGLRARGNAKDVLSLHLGHGDVVVMHGAKIQEYYEVCDHAVPIETEADLWRQHAVDPIGKLRFALTCRYIDPESLSPEDRPEYVVEPDDGDYDGARLPQVAV